MHKQLRVLIGLLFILAMLTAGSVYAAPSGNIIYVKHDAVGNNDGSSWNDAYTDLKDALGTAQAGHEIWVAQGVYYPAPDASDRYATFELQDSVQLYGGFTGTETQREQRDSESNVTVLSGDLDRNDTTANGVVTDPDNIIGDNAHHVVSGNGVTETSVLDGFTVTGGKAEGSWPDSTGGGMYNDNSSPTLRNMTFSGNLALYGAGMYNWFSNPALDNVIFSGNKASDAGGGMSNGYSSPTLTNVTFTGNRAGAWGGGMRNFQSNPVLTNVAFTGNYSTCCGGGMSNARSSLTLNNVIFSGNKAGYHGGGMSNERTSPTMTNVTLSGNNAHRNGGGMHNYDNSSPTLANCILWRNDARLEGPQIFNTGEDSSPALSYSNIEGSGGSGVGWDEALGIDHGDNIDADPLFVDSVSANQAPTTDGDYRLTKDSPAIDAGNNDVITVDTDLDGNPRIADGTGDGNAVVDMGAYEFQIPLLTIITQGQGLVTSKPGLIDCGNVCTAQFLPGTIVTLTAIAEPGWTFEAWSGNIMNIDNPLELTTQYNTVITATFTQHEYTLDVDIVGQGEVHVEPDQDTYFYGQVVTLTATAHHGWTFMAWNRNITTTTNPLALTLNESATVTATFQQVKPVGGSTAPRHISDSLALTLGFSALLSLVLTGVAVARRAVH